jgi:hypothetical protein
MSETDIPLGDCRVDDLLHATTPAAPPLTVVDWQICYEASGPSPGHWH